MRGLVSDIQELEEKLKAGGGAKKIEKQHSEGKLTARERVAHDDRSSGAFHEDVGFEAVEAGDLAQVEGAAELADDQSFFLALAIIEHMNKDHSDSLLLLAKFFAGVEAEQATMTSVDRLGFHVRLKTQDGMKGARIAFPREAKTPADTRKVLVEMVQQARQRA